MSADRAAKSKERLLYTVEEAADLMRLNRSQVYVLTSTGQIEWVNATVTGKRPRVRIAHEQIEAWIKRRTVPAASSKRRAA